MCAINCSGGCVDCAPEDHTVLYTVVYFFGWHEEVMFSSNHLAPAIQERDKLRGTLSSETDGSHHIVVEIP